MTQFQNQDFCRHDICEGMNFLLTPNPDKSNDNIFGKIFNTLIFGCFGLKKKHFSGKIGLYVPSRKKLKIKLKIKKLKIMNGYHGKMQTE